MENLLDRCPLPSSKSDTFLYKARFQPLDQEVLVKERLFESFEKANEAVREALFQLRMQHPAVVEIKTQSLEQEDDQWKAVIVMELLATDLEEELKRRRRKKQSWSERELLDMLKSLVSALSLAQQRSIVHRDITLKNLLLAESGEVKLGDFGLSKWDCGSLEEHSCKGTLVYMSPLLRQAAASALVNSMNVHDIRTPHNMYKSDVYSLGVCFLCLASSKLPGEIKGEGNPAEVILQEVRSLSEYRTLQTHLEVMLRPAEESRPDFVELSSLLANSSRMPPPDLAEVSPFDILPRPTIVIEDDGFGRLKAQQNNPFVPPVLDTPTDPPVGLSPERRGRHSESAFLLKSPVSPFPLETCLQCHGGLIRRRFVLPCGHAYCSLPCLLTYMAARTYYFQLRPALMCQSCSSPFSYVQVYQWVGGSQAYHRLSLQVQRTCFHCPTRNAQYRLAQSDQYSCYECLGYAKEYLHAQAHLNALRTWGV